jgi:hypothetical protein
VVRLRSYLPGKDAANQPWLHHTVPSPVPDTLAPHAEL